MKVRLDVTKRLVRGKKITVEGGDSRWVNFKYERLPNFCYQCGLLNHALKECPETGEKNKSTEEEVLQYGAWMKGDITRRYAQDQNKPSMGRGTDIGANRWGIGTESERGTVNFSANKLSVEVGGDPGPQQLSVENRPPNRWSTAAESERRTVNPDAKENSVVSGGAHGLRLSSVETFPLTQQKVTPGADVKRLVGLHVKGMGDGMVEKKELKLPDLGVDALLQEKTQTTETKGMMWDESIDQREKVVRE